MRPNASKRVKTRQKTPKLVQTDHLVAASLIWFLGHMSSDKPVAAELTWLLGLMSSDKLGAAKLIWLLSLMSSDQLRFTYHVMLLQNQSTKIFLGQIDRLN